jgi:hypothetical protein
MGKERVSGWQAKTRHEAPAIEEDGSQRNGIEERLDAEKESQGQFSEDCLKTQQKRWTGRSASTYIRSRKPGAGKWLGQLWANAHRQPLRP